MAAKKADLAMRVGRNIRRYREAIVPEMTQRRLAARMAELGDTSVDSQAVSDWERGVRKPSERHMPYLLAALGLPDAGALYIDPDAEAQSEQTQLDRIERRLVDLQDEMVRLLAAQANPDRKDIPGQG